MFQINYCAEGISAQSPQITTFTEKQYDFHNRFMKLFDLLFSCNLQRTCEADAAHSFLQSVADHFHVVILSLPMKFYILLSKNLSKPTI